MPHRNRLNDRVAEPARGDFRHRYDEVESRREALLVRLNRLRANDQAQSHPGYKRALKLLNETFRKAKLAQRMSVLQAAAWLIEVLERLTFGL